MKIIDFHTHIYPDQLAVKGSQSICDFYHLEYRYDGSAETLLAEGKKAGVSRFVLLPVAVKPEYTKAINRFSAQISMEHQEFYGFGTVHAEMDDPISELENILNLGLYGIKIHPDTQRFPIDDPRMDGFYDAVSGKLPILFHCGDPRYEFSRPERLKRVLRRFPKLQVVAAHLGGWSMFETAHEYLKNESCYFDISSCMMFLPKEAVEGYIKSYGAARLVFGTDFPSWSPKKEVESFLRLNLTNREQEMIAHENAEQILELR